MEAYVIEDFKKWLGKNGISYFQSLKKIHGTVSPVLMESGIPRPVHFREGMQIRNWMRGHKAFTGYTDHDFDNNWISLVEEAIQ